MNAIGNIFVNGSGWPLSPRAERVARFLMASPNQIHMRDDLAHACDIMVGRAIDTYIAEIRKSLGSLERIVSAHGRGYGWIGESVPLAAVVKQHKKAVRNDEMYTFAVMSQADVGKHLGITAQAVSLIEKQALSKLRKKPELKKAWMELLTHKKRATYDPYHEIWLYAVGENIATYNESAKEGVTE
jgi:DNA-binding XRE family transcriptional regulator